MIWQVSTGKLLKTLKVHSTPVFSVIISPDGQPLRGSQKSNSPEWRYRHYYKGFPYRPHKASSKF